MVGMLLREAGLHIHFSAALVFSLLLQKLLENYPCSGWKLYDHLQKWVW
jgi:hypothetical protein